MLGRHPVVDRVAANAMLVGLQSRGDATGFAAAVNQSAAMDIDVGAIVGGQIRGRPDMDHGSAQLGGLHRRSRRRRRAPGSPRDRGLDSRPGLGPSLEVVRRR